jgi:preprotein translocase subunit SecG
MPSWMKWGISLVIGVAIIALGFRYSGGLLKAFFVMNCLVLIVVVLLQSGKAADLAGAFGGAGSQTAFGPRGAATILSQATTWCAIMFMLCALAMVVRVDRAAGVGGSVIYDTQKPASKPATTPAQAPATSTPATTPPATQQPQQQAPTSTPQQQQPQTPTQTPPQKK